MIPKTKRLLKKHAVRYLLVGGSVYVFELVIIIVAQAFGANDVLAVAISFTFGTLVSFLLQKFITFGDKRTHRKVITLQFLATCLLVVFNFGFTLLIAKLFMNIVPAVISRTIALALTTLWNFYLYKTRIFKSTQP